MALSSLPVLKWTTDQRTWVAGLLDGEGWIGITKMRCKTARGGYWYRAGITVSQTRPEMVDRLRALLGGRGTRFVERRAARGNRKDAYGVNVFNQSLVEAVLSEVGDHLVVKRQVAAVVLEYRQYMRASPQGSTRGDPATWAVYYQRAADAAEAARTDGVQVTEAPPAGGDDAWLAALVDGEGTITINFFRGPRGSGTYIPRIEVGSTTEALVRRVHAVVGVGSVQCEQRGTGRTVGQRPLWRWVVGTRGIAPVLDRIEPHLLLKKAQARVVRELLALPRMRGRQRVPSWVRVRQEELRDELRGLNRKGRNAHA